jgi:hypothetical protein
VHTLDSKNKLFVRAFVVCTRAWDMKVFCHFCWIELMLVDMNVMCILHLL